jgi:hypothetical protein
MKYIERPMATLYSENNKNWVTIRLGPFPIKEWNVPCDSYGHASDLYNCISHWHRDTLIVVREMRLTADKLEGK